MLTPLDFFKTGHRGCRGLYPENTIKGFMKAIEAGVDALELDVVVSLDGKLVVSHEPYMNPEICLKPDGSEIKLDEVEMYNLYKMPYDEIRTFDCGLKKHPRFPKQIKEKNYKPLLSEVVDSTEAFLKERNLVSIIYDIEIKSEEIEYEISQPLPNAFAEKLAKFIYEKKISEKVIVRSFDPAPLQYLHKNYPLLPLALIVENGLSAEQNISQLGFLPYIYSPEYVLLNKKEMAFLKQQSVLVVPWTVNTAEKIKEMLRFEVDGIITDYPDLFKTMGI
jgi:glycerophosphoryl diester phosphodiesterase